MPNIKREHPTVMYPNMPNQMAGGIEPYGTPPAKGTIAPFWYLQKRPETPIRERALKTAFQQAARPVQREVTRRRHPFDRHRGY